MHVKDSLLSLLEIFILLLEYLDIVGASGLDPYTYYTNSTMRFRVRYHPLIYLGSLFYQVTTQSVDNNKPIHMSEISFLARTSLKSALLTSFNVNKNND